MTDKPVKTSKKKKKSVEEMHRIYICIIAPCTPSGCIWWPSKVKFRKPRSASVFLLFPLFIIRLPFRFAIKRIRFTWTHICVCSYGARLQNVRSPECVDYSCHSCCIIHISVDIFLLRNFCFISRRILEMNVSLECQVFGCFIRG